MAAIGDPQGTVGVQVLAALGLPARQCVRLTLEFEPNSIVRAIAEYAPSDPEIREIAEIVRTLAATGGSVKHHEQC